MISGYRVKKSIRHLWIALLAVALLTACQALAPVAQPVTPQPILPSATAPLPSVTPTGIPIPLPSPAPTTTLQPSGAWLAGDFHHHTFLTDGRRSEADILEHGFRQYGLDWMANSEHGGISGRDPQGALWDDPTLAGKVNLLGDAAVYDKTHPGMWRWQSLRDFSWPLLFGGVDGSGVNQPGLQTLYPDKLLIQGLEWNVPGYEHASVAILNQPDGIAISDFEYSFDAADRDASRFNLPKRNQTHADALAAVRYLAENFSGNSYVVINHPSRLQTYSAANLRDMIDSAPEVVLGLEGMPGHQKSPVRGDYNARFYANADQKDLDQAKTDRARTYGGADYMLAQVGGLMDSLWGEGRRFWVFVNSDFHNDAENADFWPGEYSKTYIYAPESTQTGILEGMRSGNVFIVNGDLIDGLDFSVADGGEVRGMGGELPVQAGNDVTVTIRFKSPPRNNHGDAPQVDHVDLIAGDLGNEFAPGEAGYQMETNPSTHILATFTRQDWKVDDQGWSTVTLILPQLQKSVYLRLRGTNLGENVPDQTQDGNPLADDRIGANNADQAYADLWFYSNPIFIRVQ
jgi:hypothetical protein